MLPHLSNHTKLWCGAAVLFTTLFMSKQIIWAVVSKQVTTIRKDEHEKAVLSLQNAYARAQSMPPVKPLGAEERAKLKEALSIGVYKKE